LLTRIEHLVESKEETLSDNKRNDGEVSDGDYSDKSVLCLFQYDSQQPNGEMQSTRPA
jgi:hypothetical protein